MTRKLMSPEAKCPISECMCHAQAGGGGGRVYKLVNLYLGGYTVVKISNI